MLVVQNMLWFFLDCSSAFLPSSLSLLYAFLVLFFSLHLRVFLYNLVTLRLHVFSFGYLTEKHKSDILADLRVQMVSGTFLVANLHGDLKQLFVMIQIFRDVEILQVVCKSNIQKSNVVQVDLVIKKWAL